MVKLKLTNVNIKSSFNIFFKEKKFEIVLVKTIYITEK